MRIVWIEHEKCWGRVLQHNTHFTLVKYSNGITDAEEWLENDDLVYPEDMGIDYETEF